MTRHATLRISLLTVLVALLCLAASAGAASVPVNASLAAGDTLYVRFMVTDMTGFPDPFNMFGTDFMFDHQYTDVSVRIAIYDDADAELGYSSSGPATSLGFGPVFYDSSRGGSGGQMDVDLSSYDDGIGMASYENTGTTSVFIETFLPRFGQKTDYGSWYPALPYDYTYAVNELPAAVPEATTLALLALGATGAVLRRRR
ncbi:MAG: PEP-CTERM sorting domain-containing protein [Phycisphaerae bacterium]